MNVSMIILYVLVTLVVIYILRGIKIVSQSETMIVERLGKYNRTLNAGINVILPIVEQAKETIVRRQMVLWLVLRALICVSKCMILTNKALSLRIM